MMRNEQGSTTPLAIGFALMSLSAILVAFSASTLFILQKRLSNFSESAVLYTASGLGSIEDFVNQIWNPQFSGQRFSQRTLDDDLTVKVTTCADWMNPIPINLTPNTLKVCAHASARTE